MIKIIIAVLILFIILIGTWYAFSSSTSINDTSAAPAAPAPAPVAPAAPAIEYPKKYYLGADCPVGWDKVGRVGIITVNRDLSKSPFTVGGAYTPDWTWVHPWLCYGEADPTNMEGLYKFADFSSKALTGMIMINRDYPKNPFMQGGALNDGWTWTHPYLISATSPNPNGYTFTDKPTDKLVGMLMSNDAYPKNPFIAGGGSYAGWTWTHPYLVKDV